MSFLICGSEIGKTLKRKKSGKKILNSIKQKKGNINYHKLMLRELKNMNWNI